MNPSDALKAIAGGQFGGRQNANCIIDSIVELFDINTINKLINHILCGYRTMYLSNRERILLVNGFIKQHDDNSSLTNFVDVVGLIIEFYSDQVFLYHLDTNSPVNQMYHLNPLTESHPFSFQLTVYPKGYVSRRNRPFNNRDDSFVDIGLYVYPNMQFPYLYSSDDPNGFSHQLTFVKFYYEIHSKDIDKLSKSMCFKGVVKYHQFKYKFVFRKFIIPRKYIQTSEFMGKKNVDITVSINYLGVQYDQNGWNNANMQQNYLQDIQIKKSVNYEWNINAKKVSMLKSVKNKDELILFSNNFDADNWCVFCKHTKKQSKKKEKFFMCLMLLKLPWWVNYIRIKLVMECNSNKKELKRKLWTGFESALQIPFKSDILEKASQLIITVTIKIINAYDAEDKIIEPTQWLQRNII